MYERIGEMVCIGFIHIGCSYVVIELRQMKENETIQSGDVKPTSVRRQVNDVQPTRSRLSQQAFSAGSILSRHEIPDGMDPSTTDSKHSSHTTGIITMPSDWMNLVLVHVCHYRQ